MGPPPGSSAITTTLLLLLESVSKLLQEESVLFDLGLKFTELLQVRASQLCGGGVLVLCCPARRRCGVARSPTRRGTVARPLVLIARPRHPESDVEALASGVVGTLVVRVGVAETVVARGQEAAHGFRVS